MERLNPPPPQHHYYHDNETHNSTGVFQNNSTFQVTEEEADKVIFGFKNLKHLKVSFH